MSNRTDSPDYAKQKILIDSLLGEHRICDAANNPRLLETHVSWVLLAGRFAYKIKKALDLGFLDFTTLESRKHFCREEIRLGCRLAPEIYLEVVPIGGNFDLPVLGVTPAIEYAVKMRRFATSKQFDRLLERGRLEPRHLERLAALLADFHCKLPGAPADSSFGASETIGSQAMQNFEPLLELLPASPAREQLAKLMAATQSEYLACAGQFAARRIEGRVRECHGDLHLGNLVLIDDAPIPFDALEFAPELRWIDVINEVAFLVMDLLHENRPDLAYRFLNCYLEASGDFAGVSVLRFYLAYRAMVRAKVSAIRAFQGDGDAKVRNRGLADCEHYLQLAQNCLEKRRPALIITCGLPGAGKSRFATVALERLGAIRIRSDVERKRLFGMKPLESSGAAVGGGIYGEEATRLTYSRLLDLARKLLVAGFPVIVDAAFLKQAEREQFGDLAQSLSAPFVIAQIEAPTEVLRERIRLRQAAANDASEADFAVLDMLLQARQPLRPEEEANSVLFANDSDRPFTDESEWARLLELISAK